MSYLELSGKKYVKWIRGENGYAFRADIFRVDKSAINGEYMMVLEDVVDISISHENLERFCNNCHRIDMAINLFHAVYADIYRWLELNLYGPEKKYDNLQRVTNFSFDRVSDVYFASYMGML